MYLFEVLGLVKEPCRVQGVPSISVLPTWLGKARCKTFHWVWC